MEVFKGMVSAFISCPRINSTCFPVLPKLWENLHSVLLNLKWLLQFWLSTENQSRNVQCQPHLSSPVFIGDSEVVLRMISRKDPANLPIFYIPKVMEISALTIPSNWFWCSCPLNPADLLTRAGSNLEQINADFWLRSSFLIQPEDFWPIKKCESLLSSPQPLTNIKRVTAHHRTASPELL